MMDVFIPETENKHEINRCYYHFMFGLLLPAIHSGFKVLNIAQCGRLDKFKSILDEVRDLVDIRPFEGSRGNKYWGLPSMEHYYTSSGVAMERMVDDSDVFDASLKLKNHYRNTYNIKPRITLIERTDNRNIKNIYALGEYLCELQDLYVSIINLDGLTLEQQIRIFAESMYIVSSHGSDLVNLMFFRGKKVIECIPISFASSNLDYYQKICDTFIITNEVIFQDEIDSRINPREVIRIINAN